MEKQFLASISVRFTAASGQVTTENYEKIIRDATQAKNRIKLFLTFFGLSIPDEFQGKNWPKEFITIVLRVASGKCAQRYAEGCDKIKYRRFHILGRPVFVNPKESLRAE